jgi:hypothetical protein
VKASAIYRLLKVHVASCVLKENSQLLLPSYRPKRKVDYNVAKSVHISRMLSFLNIVGLYVMTDVSVLEFHINSPFLFAVGGCISS